MSETSRGDVFRQPLTEYLEAVTGESVSLLTLKPLAGGASRDNWLMEAKIGDESQRLVLRRDSATTMSEMALERDQEFKIMKAVHAGGVSVPQPRWYCLEPLILGAPFLIMDFGEGVSIGRQVVSQPELDAARAALPEQLGVQLARIHAVKLTKNDLSFLPKPRKELSPAQEAVKQIRETLSKLKIYNPVFEFALRWLSQNMPSPSSEMALLHGDFRVGNFLVKEDGLNGIIDWEFAHIGDPLEDLAWPCLRDWRYGQGKLQFGGLSPREPFLQAYERESGRKIDRKAVDYWEILGNLRWAVACLAQANRHLSGADASVELASLGRRSAEMQMELLRLIAAQGINDHV